MKKTALVGLVLGLSSTFALAHGQEDAPLKYKAATEARINLHQAIDMAEKQSGGKVTRVSFLQRGAAWVYDMDVQTAGGALAMEIDAASGVLRPAPPAR